MSSAQDDAPLTLDYYLDEALYRREVDRVFANTWLLIAHGGRVSQPGDAIATELFGNRILIRRGLDQNVNSFHNICRHRGASLLSNGEHCRSILRCPYHGWTYDDRGRLRAAPRFNTVGLPEKSEELALFMIQTVEYRRMVFANLAASHASFDSVLAPVTSILDSFEVTGMEFSGTLEFNFECNWKLYVENWLESYHIPWLHREFVQDVDVGHYEVRIQGNSVCHRSRPARDGAVYAGAWVWLWPLTAWNFYDGGVSIERVIPTACGSTRVEFTFLFASGIPKHKREATVEMCRTVTSQDGGMCEDVQRNIRSGRYVPGPLSPIHEHAVRHFHGLVRRAIR